MILGSAAAAQPGPFQAYLLSHTLKHGGKRTLVAALAPLISDGPIIALMLFVLTQTPLWLLRLVQFAGGLFLLYLAREAYLAYRTADFADLNRAQTPSHGLLKAAVMNALNPNPYIFWGTVAGPLLLEGWQQSPLAGFGFLLGFYAMLVGGFAGFVLLFATAGRLDARIGRTLSGLSAAALFLFGLYQLAAVIRSLSGA